MCKTSWGTIWFRFDLIRFRKDFSEPSDHGVILSFFIFASVCSLHHFPLIIYYFSDWENLRRQSEKKLVCAEIWRPCYNYRRICRPPPLRSGYLDIKDGQCAGNKDGRKTSYHCISRLDATGVQKGYFGRPKIQLSSKVTKFAGYIGITLALIFCINDFFFTILSFWDTVNFSNYCVQILKCST